MSNTEQDRITSPGAMWPAGLMVLAFSFIALTLPDHPGAFGLKTFLRLPLELPLILLGLLLLPQRMARIFAGLATLTLLLLLLLKVADIGVQSAFHRRFNPYLDMKMLTDGWHLLAGTVGSALAGLGLGLAIVVIVALAIVFFRAQQRVSQWQGRRRKRTLIAALLLLSAGLALMAAGPFTYARADFRAAGYLGHRIELMQQGVADLREFETQITRADSIASADDLFAGIRGRDFILIFVESYGRSSLDDERYSPLIRPRLAEVEAQLLGSGFASASGWLASSTVGGLSWLAHGTFLSGLWIDSQARYNRLMISERASLNRLFQQAGWQTSAVMPAITMAWPEASYFGYDQILVAADLEYRGKPYNWVTMPDQYTLTAYERLARQPAHAAGKASMTEIALISSHAPWTPVATLIDWDKVGDGRVFNEEAESGESPPQVWADHDKVRDHYIRTVDYSLQTLGDYVARFAEDAIVMILGDHQPARIITGSISTHAVPVHVISRDQALVERFRAEGFSAGMTPAADAPELPMDSMRDRLVRLFATSP